MKKNIMILWGAVLGSILVLLSILIPGILVKKIPDGRYPERQIKPKLELVIEDKQALHVPIYLTHQQRVEKVPLELYVRGVIAAEMPVEFELEALKAQALAARTYIVRRILEQDNSKVPTKEAWVTDTISHQAYVSEEQLKIQWDISDYIKNIEKLNRAVNETRGLIVTYQNKPIDATFFSTSNGYTVNAEDYWKEQVPYLRSVRSPWDEVLSPRYKETVSYKYREMLGKLGIRSVAASGASGAGMKVIETAEGRSINKILIENKVFTGREVREKLGLNSAQFSWKIKGANIEFTTYGYGHGVGMSQWGANGMAKEGKNAEEIVKHYYTGVQISKIPTIVKW